MRELPNAVIFPNFLTHNTASNTSVRVIVKVLVTGANGLVGSAIVRRLQAEPSIEIIATTRIELNLLDEQATSAYLGRVKPEVVIGAAAVVGGIKANLGEPVRFLLENLAIQNNLMMASARAGVSKFVFLASSCIYPRLAPQPMSESALMTGPLEPTNESYAVAKLAGIQLARSLQQEGSLASLVVIPPNIYGPNDHFDVERSHVLSSLVRRFTDAVLDNSKTITVWGTGSARREFMYSDDLADAILLLLRDSSVPFLINVGVGEDISIRDAAQLIAEITEFKGDIEFDPNQPEGMPQKLLDSSVIQQLGWRPRVSIVDGLKQLASEYRSKISV